MSSPLSAFTAIPNPQMPAFLGAQSFIMMYQAGEGWQYGKRRISALSNEDFNQITPQSLMERQAMELKGAIPIIERSMNNMTQMVPMIIQQYGDFIREAIKAMPQMVQNIVGGQAGANLQSNMAGLNDVLKFLASLLPQLPPAEAKLVEAKIVQVESIIHDFDQGSEFSGTDVNSFRDTSGIPLRLHESIKRFKEVALAKAKLERAITVKQFGSTTIQDQVGIIQKAAERTGQIIKPKAGQTQKQARDRLILLIRLKGKEVSVALRSTSARKAGIIAARKKELQYFQTQLAQLLNRYRW